MGPDLPNGCTFRLNLCKFMRINLLLFPLKISENRKFSEILMGELGDNPYFGITFLKVRNRSLNKIKKKVKLYNFNTRRHLHIQS